MKNLVAFYLFSTCLCTLSGQVNLRPYFNSSCFDDGISDNAVGGWTDEGLNDFVTYPPMSFGLQSLRGYLFDWVDPETQNGKNLVLIGHTQQWPDLSPSVLLSDLNQKARYLFIMHSEGRILDETSGRTAGSVEITYQDGSTATFPLRMKKELHNWYQGNWWNNFEEAHDDAPSALLESECNPERYKELGGTDFEADVLQHATAVRWPVTQGMNAISKSWGLPVVFWASKWELPHPEKPIVSILISTDETYLMGIAAVTLSDEDYSLKRHTEEGQVRKPPDVPTDFFTARSQKAEKSRLPLLAAQPWTKGLRRVEMRAADIVTVVVDQIAALDELKKPANFILTSAEDPDFGKGVHPTEVYRFSRGGRYRALPPEQPKVYMDHWLHLKFPSPLKENLTYTLELTGELIPPPLEGLTRSQTFQPGATPNPSFKCNQVGYSASAGKKYVYLSSYLGDGPAVDLSPFKTFSVVDEATGRSVFQGPVEKISDRDPQGLDRLYRLDISNLKQEGRFHVVIPGFGRSYSFANGDSAAKAMYQVCHRGMYFQRSGQEVAEPFAEGWTRPMAHNKIFVTKENLNHPITPVDPSEPGHAYSVPEGARPFSGGHYDAGDYDIRAMHINIPELFLTLYEAMPEKFTDGQVNIPENQNGIPDIVDEAAWNLLALEQIQDYASEVRGLEGGVAPGLETYAHPHAGQGMGKDPLPYYMRKVTGYSSFCAAAEFAHMARIIADFDKERAKIYLSRAAKAYQYAMNHLDDPQPLMSNGRADQGQGWKESQLNRARLWANVELYCSTGKQRFWDELVALKDTPADSVAGSVQHGVLFSLLLSKRTHPDPALVEGLKKDLLIRADNKLKKIEEENAEGYAVPAPKGGGWGNTSCLVRNIEEVTRAYMLTRNPAYLDAIATAIDFSFGMNPTEMSWVTGAGSVSPMDPLNLNCIDDGIEAPHPGILWYGPSNYWQKDKIQLYPDKTDMGFYRRVADVWGEPTQNEYSVWETQAPLLFGVGCLLPDLDR